MNTLSSYLSFNGNCEEAMNLYAKTFGGTLEYKMTWKESPMCDQVPVDYQDKLMHSTLRVGNTVIMASDAPPERYSKTQGITVSISVPEFDEAKKVFDILADAGQVTMPFQETFWAKGFGMCTDKFGIPWMVNCEKPMPQ